MLIGCARVPTRDQDPIDQADALTAAGYERVFPETASGARRDRPELTAALDYRRAGNMLVAWELDRPARSVRQLVETAEDHGEREIGLRVLTQQFDTTNVGRRRPALDEAEVKRAKGMLKDPTITVEEVAHQLGVQPSTLCRHIPGGRSSLAERVAA